MTHLIKFLEAITATPTVIQLEDIHWADDSSLDLIDNVVTTLDNAWLLVV